VCFIKSSLHTTAKGKKSMGVYAEIKAIEKKVMFRTNSKEPKKKLANNLLEFSNAWNGKQKRQHPTQKPVAMLEKLILSYTLEGETVLDFTMGSGSTGVACKNLNRDFVGIEKEEKYFNIAKERIFD
jgi:site-specific DNA-methyltransferase (adenine-specific)